jgi:hypothetical protein
LIVKEITESKIHYDSKELLTKEPDYELKTLMTNDLNFLDNVTIEFNKLPIWLQNLYNSNKVPNNFNETTYPILKKVYLKM